MKNFEMINFVREFSTFDNLEGFDLIIRLNKNKRLFEQELKIIDETKTHNPGFKNYQAEVESILVKYADKDENGKPIIDPVQGQPGRGNYRITKSRPEFDEAHKAIVAKYEKDIQKQSKLEEDFNNSMIKDIMCTPFMIKEEMLPHNITSKQMNLLYPLISFKMTQPGKTTKRPK